jgi:hypothetical protein
VAVAVGVTDAVGVGSVPPPLQLTPLRVNAVGLVLVPEYVPLKPTFVVAPEARLPFQDALVILTCLAVCVSTPFHAVPACWLPA